MLNLIFTLIMAGTIYAHAGTVTDVQEGGRYANDYVTVTDACGRAYTMYADDLQEGDAVALLMYDAGTPDMVTDDIVLSARYIAQ